jgi:predicted MFS family arabinose efflux permease
MTTVPALPCTRVMNSAMRTPPACAKSAARWILATTILASSMAFIDGTVVNVMLPALQRSLGATLASSQWVIEAYELVLAALMLVGGSAGDRFGRRRVFVIGVVIFTASSVICGLSRRVEMVRIHCHYQRLRPGVGRFSH